MKRGLRGSPCGFVSTHVGSAANQPSGEVTRIASVSPFLEDSTLKNNGPQAFCWFFRPTTCGPLIGCGFIITQIYRSAGGMCVKT